MQAACALARRLCEHCAGPMGTPVVVCDSAGSRHPAVRSDAVCGAVLGDLMPSVASFVDELSPACAERAELHNNVYFRSLLGGVLAHVGAEHDCGWLRLFVTSDVVSAAASGAALLPMPHEMSAHLRAIEQWGADALADPHGVGARCGAQALPCVVEGMLRAAALHRYFDVERLALTLLSATSHCLDEASGRMLPQRVRLLVVPAAAEEVSLLPGVLVPLDASMEEELLAAAAAEGSAPMDGAVLLFACGLEYSMTTARGFHALLRSWETGSGGEPRRVVVASQRTIDPRLRELCFSCGVLCIERLSIHHVHVVRAAAGCVLHHVVDFATLTAELERAPGAVRLRRVMVGGSSYLHISGSGSGSDGMTVPSIVTMVLACSDISAADAVEMEVRRAIHLACRLATDAHVTPGGGSLEIFLERYLQVRALLEPATMRPTVGLVRGALLAFVQRVVAKAAVGGDAQVRALQCAVERETNLFDLAARHARCPVAGPPKRCDGPPGTPQLLPAPASLLAVGARRVCSGIVDGVLAPMMELEWDGRRWFVSWTVCCESRAAKRAAILSALDTAATFVLVHGVRVTRPEAPHEGPVDVLRAHEGGAMSVL